MMYLGIALLCLGLVPGSFSKDDIHEYMTPEELQQVFLTDRDSVPEYEVVKINISERLHKRDLPAGSKMHITAFGEDINLWLNPGDSVLVGDETPVWYARYSPFEPEQVEYKRRDGLMGVVGRIFEDPDTLASMVIGTENSGRTTVNGYIASKGITVRSLPSRVAQEYVQRRPSADNIHNLDSSYHVVIKSGENFAEDPAVLPVDVAALRQRLSQSGSGYPDTLYPEILVVVDFSMHSAYGRDIYGLLQYIMAFWNGVDLKYRTLESPKVRFHISGIVLSEDPLATPYISRHSLGPNSFNSTRAMNDATTFFYGVKNTFPLDSYDIPVTMTRQTFEASGIMGKAWVGFACKRSDLQRTNNAVAIIRDDGGFLGVQIAAHEVGHSLGANHDDAKGQCTYRDGYLMSSFLYYSKNSSDFSPCSTNDMDAALKSSKLDCLFNRPESYGKKLPNLMPGRVKDLEEQCKIQGMGAPCQNESDDICLNIRCIDKNGSCEWGGLAAAEGTSCGDNKFCLHMQCVSL